MLILLTKWNQVQDSIISCCWRGVKNKIMSRNKHTTDNSNVRKWNLIFSKITESMLLIWWTVVWAQLPKSSLIIARKLRSRMWINIMSFVWRKWNQCVQQARRNLKKYCKDHCQQGDTEHNHQEEFLTINRKFNKLNWKRQIVAAILLQTATY